MFESTESTLIEPSEEDTNKYDNICPTIVSWTQEEGEWEEKVVLEDTFISRMTGV